MQEDPLPREGEFTSRQWGDVGRAEWGLGGVFLSRMRAVRPDQGSGSGVGMAAKAATASYTLSHA